MRTKVELVFGSEAQQALNIMQWKSVDGFFDVENIRESMKPTQANTSSKPTFCC